MSTINKSKNNQNDETLINSNKILVNLDRDSVCMGDDCQSHKIRRSFEDKMSVEDFLHELSCYVPSMSNVVWAILCSSTINTVLGYIITNKDCMPTIESEFEKHSLKQLFEAKIDIDVYCRYYHQSSFSWIDGATNRSIEKHSEYKTLLEKVKAEYSK
ncbi:hypothetical protein JHL18_06255 [Clostridium sp. YIM B02505]|uniref:Uncharacterized protein n=1 Tax=Clostridium yunnanense TaxID=2800325 RepID=A0ABS1ELQ5_9CLOT|nr:hypothetical protein [Clostridium yunnanense]MBK1810238.1 hypothetical protein [Clostridium yunnanense]